MGWSAHFLAHLCDGDEVVHQRAEITGASSRSEQDRLTLLRSQNASVRKIIMKLEPDEFQTEQDLYKMLDAISKSPLGQLPLPDAGQKIGNYYRKLFRRRGEAATDFLIREDNVHDEMWRALQRLLKDMDVKWEDYGYDKEELETLLEGLDGTAPWTRPTTHKELPDEPDAASAAEQETETSGGARSSRSARRLLKEEASPPDLATTAGDHLDEASQVASQASWTRWPSGGDAGWWSYDRDDRWHGKPKKQEKDLTQKLMEKGLVPLAAFEVIRGWMLLEMMAFTDTEKNMVKASTQNRLDYRSVSQALRAQWSDRSLQTRDHKPHSAMWVDAGEEAWTTDEWTSDTWDSESWTAVSDGGWQEAQWNEQPNVDTKDQAEDTI